MLPYGRHSIDDSDVEAVTAVLRGDWLTTGPAVAAFERDLSTWTGGRSAVAVTSGTAALHVAYQAAGIGPGAEVITTPMTFVATAATAVLLGARVVFADVDADTANLSPEAVSAVASSRTAAVTAVDFAGHPADLDALGEIARQHGAVLIEDAAHAIGARWQGQPVGSFADLTTLSFFPTKTVTTAEGGAVVTGDPDLLARARGFRNHGLIRDRALQRTPDEGGWHQEVHAFGLNYRLPDVLCALGSSQLRRLGGFIARRAEIHRRYDEGLRNLPGIKTPVTRPGAEPAWHLYSIQVRDGRRRALYDHLRARDIGVQVNYLPVYWHPVFADLGYTRGSCPVAEEYYAQQLSLPLFPDLTDADVDRVIEGIHSFFRT